MKRLGRAMAYGIGALLCVGWMACGAAAPREAGEAKRHTEDGNEANGKETAPGHAESEGLDYGLTEEAATEEGVRERGAGAGAGEEEDGLAGTLRAEYAGMEQEGGAFDETESVNEGSVENMPQDDGMALLEERMPYYQRSAYCSEIGDYWENVREVRDIACRTEPLYETDQRYLSRDELADEPPLVIHLAKNEIYARHGYIFQNEDLYNYFMGCIWYTPTTAPADFDDGVFNEYEKANLELLSSMDDW